MHWEIMVGKTSYVRMNIAKLPFRNVTFYDINLLYKSQTTFGLAYSFPAFKYDNPEHEFFSLFFIGV